MDKSEKKILSFQPRLGENILFHSQHNRKWYAIAWKIITGVLGIGMLTFIIVALFEGVGEDILANFLPEAIAKPISYSMCIGVLPLLITLWYVDEVARLFTGEYILTDQRIWIKGSPYSWSRFEVPLDDIESMTFRRDSIFLRQKSNRKMHIHMIADGKHFFKTYQQVNLQKTTPANR